MNFKNRTKLKATLLSAAAVATSCLIGMAACTAKPQDSNEDDKTVTKQDVQLIKNGNFEFYDDNDGLYPISSPDNWSSGYKGNSSNAMGGVINTSKARWDYITDPTLPQTLKTNNDLNSADENKKDYNGALEDDMLYRNSHDAIKSDAKEEDKKYIENPFTHEYKYGEDGKLVDTDGKEVETYEKDGKTYVDEECTKELETSVLMLHNYRSSYYKGTETYYSSTSTVTLEARTAAKLSVWVKTAYLRFDGTKNEGVDVENEHGAYIQVDTSVGGNSLDSFYIRNINTKYLNPDDENNGWVRYTVYVQASSFASTTVDLTLGLGQDDQYTVEGYAFFDDVEMVKYESSEEMIKKANEELGENKFGEKTENSTANLLSPDGKSEFRVDEVTFKTNDDNGNIVDKSFKHNSADRHFYIDLTSSAVNETINFDQNSVAAGFTVEKTNTGKYVCSKNGETVRDGVTSLDNGAGNAYLPSSTFEGIKVSNDIIATVGISGDTVNLPARSVDADKDYTKILTEALKTASALPGADGNTNALVILSANGAAYEAELTNDSFKLGAGKQALITFWIKTSDMDGKTAATVTVKDADEKASNSSNFTLDSTTVGGVTINDIEDVYNGWVECFIRVENTCKDTEKEFKITFNFGNTTIKGTEETAYKAGWMAVANASFMLLDEDVYSYTSGLSNSASLTLSDTENKKGDVFDSEQGDKNVIKTDLATPASYTGVNGASAEVINKNSDATEYDETNRNPYAGLLNKENLDNYKGCGWYSAIEALKNLNDNEAIWNKLAGKYSTQPLLIVNTARVFKEISEEGAIYNYGYIGGNSSVSSNGYVAVSVKVKASTGAIANVYLVDTEKSSKQVLDFSMPEFTFWYDDDGNILKGEPKEKASADEIKANIAYKLRSDGLYELAENGDGKLYANFYNLKKYYDFNLEHETFYDENGKIVAFENLVQGETYYANAQMTAYAPHYLVAGDSDKVYKYNSGLEKDNNLAYNYMVDGKPDAGKLVYGVDTEKAKPRYDYSNEKETPYQFTIDTISNPEYADKWVTVTFYLKAGSESKNYKLELWSGYRDQQTTAGVTEGSYVLFDYNSESLSESSYNGAVGYYTEKIIDAYKSVITGEQDKNSDSIAYYENLAENKVDVFNYEAKYYTYTLYDSASYVPFNADTAKDDETGYAYNYSDYSESLAYLRVEDFDGSEYYMSAFVDYSNFDKEISLGKQTTVDNDDNDGTTATTNNTNFWLLLASIILLAAILIAILAIIVKDLIKKLRRNKKSGKNTYNFTKNKRYVRKYVKANGEVTKVEEGKVDESLLTDKEPEATAEETSVEEATEASAEEAQAEPAEDSPAEEVNAEEAKPEAPAEEATPVEENKGDESDGENKE